MKKNGRQIPIKRAVSDEHHDDGDDDALQWCHQLDNVEQSHRDTQPVEMSSIRQVLETEMSKMEAEMERFKVDRGKEQQRQQLMEGQQLEKDKLELASKDNIAPAQEEATPLVSDNVDIQSRLESTSLPIFSHQSEDENLENLSQQPQQALDEQTNVIKSHNNNATNQVHQEKQENHQASTMSDRESTPSSLINDPLASLAGSNRATTTERRTTTTTTTKRTVKSSDDFIPSATDIQQVRSESRTGSVSSSSSPLFSSAQHNDSQHQQQQASSSSTTTTTTTSKQGGAKSGWSEGIQSPLIQDTEEGRVLKLRFDVTQYEPDEIVVKTVDNRLTVHAKHEERSENRSVYREYNREFHLPDGTDVEQIRSSLSKDGVLTVDCPLPCPQLHGASRRIPIEKA